MKLEILVPSVLVALFWGLYGPSLALSRTALGSPFKPYVMIGIAYVLWGVLGGLGGMLWKGDTFVFTGSGSLWGFIAGSLGAFGALALTLAMFAGGSRIPHIVMSIVFGGAVTVSAVAGVWKMREEGYGSLWLWIGMLGMLCSTILVVSYTPQEHPKAARLPVSVSGDQLSARP